MQGASDRPEATFLALADGEVVAYAKLALSLARPAVAMHDMNVPSPIRLTLIVLTPVRIHGCGIIRVTAPPPCLVDLA